MIVPCYIILLYQSGVLVEAKYQIEVAQDKGNLIQYWYLQNKLEVQKQKAERICEERKAQ